MVAWLAHQQLAALKRYINCSNNNRGSQTTNDVKNPTKCYLFSLIKETAARAPKRLQAAGVGFLAACKRQGLVYCRPSRCESQLSQTFLGLRLSFTGAAGPQAGCTATPAWNGTHTET
jgi:hypothetical protein